MLPSLFKYRRFIWSHALSDLRHRYAGTGMGMAWNVIHPLGVITIYSLVFTSIMKPRAALPDRTLAFTVYLCSGFFPWLAFTDCVTRGCNAFLANANYLKKLPIPEQVFVAQNVVSSSLSLAINFALLLVIAVAARFTPNWRWLLLPVPLVLFQFLGFGIGLLLGTINVFLRDVGEWTAIILQMLMWTLPIVYVPAILEPWMQALLPWHPMMPAISAIHDLFVFSRLPTAATWAAMVAWPAAAILAAAFVLHKLRPEIRDVI